MVTAVEPTWIASAPVQIRHQLTIERPVASVWASLADDEGWVAWFPGFRRCRYTTPAPAGAGSRREVQQDQLKVVEQITAWEPDQRWAMTVLEMNVPLLRSMAEEVHLSATGEATTHLDWVIGLEPTLLGRLVLPVMVPKTRRSLQTAMANLGARAESLA